MSASPPDLYAVIGYPVAHSFSPFIHGLFAKQTGQNLEYRKLEIAPANLASDVERFFAEGGKGLNVTLPHKQAVVRLCKTRSERATRAGAVNTLALISGQLFGDNTDGIGLVTDLKKNLSFSPSGKRILLLGAGGAARGVLAPLLAEKPRLVHILNRSPETAKALAAEFRDLGELSGGSFDATDGAAYDLIVNATSASLSGLIPPISESSLGRTTLCYDMAYSPEDTPFTRWAKERRAGGAELGWGMLVEQAGESFYLWRGVRPDTAEVLKALRSRAPQRVMP